MSGVVLWGPHGILYLSKTGVHRPCCIKWKDYFLDISSSGGSCCRCCHCWLCFLSRWWCFFFFHFLCSCRRLLKCNILGLFMSVADDILILSVSCINPYWFFSPYRQPGKYARWHTCPGNILLSLKEDWQQHVNRKFTFLVFSRNQSHRTSCLLILRTDAVELVNTENPGTNENQDLLDCHRTERNVFTLPALIWID